MSREVIEWEYLSRRKSATEIHDTALKEIELKYQFMLTTGFSPWYFSTQSGYNNFSVIISRKEDIKSLAVHSIFGDTQKNYCPVNT